MKTQTSKQKIWLRSFILLPLLALTLYSFSDRKEITKEIKVLNNNPTLEINHNPETFRLNGKSTSLSHLKKDFLEATNNKKSELKIITVGGIKMSLIYEIKEELKYNLIKISLAKDAFIIDDTFTNEYQQQTIRNQDGASREQMKEYNRLAKHYNSMPEKKRIIKQKDVERMEYIYSLMSDNQKKDAESMPNIPPSPPAPNAPDVIEAEEVLPPPPPPIPDNATKEQKEKYKKITAEYAKRYPESVSRYKSKSGKTIEEVEIPTSMIPPPPIPDNATKEQKKKYKQSIKKYKLAKEKSKQMQARVNTMSKKEIAMLKKQKEAYASRQTMLKREKLAYKEARAEKMKTERAELARVKELKSEEVKKLKQEKLAYKEAQATKMQAKNRELKQVREIKKAEIAKLRNEKMAYAEAQKAKLSKEKRLAIVNEIKTPKPPKSPLDHVVDMAKKGAIFYLEGKKVSSDKAISALKKNRKLNIQIVEDHKDGPLVKITNKPIYLKFEN